MLFAGNVLYALAGYSVHHDLLWVFTKVPYAKLSSTYGSGRLVDFFFHVNFVFERVNYVLFLIGLAVLIWHLRNTRLLTWLKRPHTLVWGSFAIYFVAHALFWYLGIFNSMGLPRVLIAVAPAVALISFEGVAFLLQRITKVIWRYTLLSLLVLALGLFPFTPRSQGIVWGSDMFIVADHALISEKVVPLLERTIPDWRTRTLVYEHPFLSVALDRDHFDPQQHLQLTSKQLDALPEDAIIIWDSWFAWVEGGVSLPYLEFFKFPVQASVLHEEKVRFVILSRR
jgi:hypothetical protein